MRVLIVSCYKKNRQGQQLFKEFVSTIKKVRIFTLFQTYSSKLIMQQGSVFIDAEIKCYLRNRETIDDFLFEQNSVHCHQESAKMFNSIEAVFIAGDQNTLPWDPTMDKISVLLRMCLVSKKFLFASGGACQSLVFLCASNIETNFKIINGNGKGSIIQDDKTINKKLSQVLNTDFMLDKVTGDLFTFNHETKKWISYGNTGLHHRLSAQKFGSLGIYIQKKSIYRPPPAVEDQVLYLSKNTERICYLSKQQLQHWALKDSKMKVLIPNQSHWVIHDFNFVNASKIFIALANSADSVQIISINNRSLGTFFNCSEEYPQTVLFLKNFIDYIYKQFSINTFGYTDIEKCYLDYNINRSSTISSTPFIVKRAGIKKEIVREQGIHHSGFAFRCNGISLVENNAISQRRGKKMRHTQVEEDIEKLIGEKKNILKEVLKVNKKRGMRTFSSTNFFKTQPKFFKRSSIRPEAFRFSKLTSYNKSKKKEMAFRDLIKQTVKADKEAKQFKIEYERPEFLLGNATIGEIRKFLHPSCKREYCPKKYHWIPGQLTQTRKLDRILNHRRSTGNIKKNAKLMGTVKKIKRVKSQKLFSSWSKYKDLDLEEGRRFPCMENTPFVPMEKILKEEELVRSVKVFLFKIFSRLLISIILAHEVSIQAHQKYRIIETSNPFNHKYREEFPDKWVAKRFNKYY